jgi:hypothetical protein
VIRVEDKTEAEKARSRGIMDDAPRLGNVYGFTLEQLSIRPGWNSREAVFNPEDPEDLWLAQSIKDSGVLEALSIVKESDNIFITNGHRRHAAAIYARDVLGAKLERIPCRLEPRGSSPLDLLFSQRDRNGGKGFNPFENGSLCKKAMALGATIDEVARRMHMSKAYVLSLIDLQAAPAAVTELVRTEVVAPTLAMQVLREAKGDASAATETLVKAVSTAKAEGKTRATAKHVERKAPDLTRHPAYKAGLRRALDLLIAEGEDARVYIEQEIG